MKTVTTVGSDRTSESTVLSTSDQRFAYWFQRGREQGIVDRLLGQESPEARGSQLPGYREGYAAGRDDR